MVLQSPHSVTLESKSLPHRTLVNICSEETQQVLCAHHNMFLTYLDAELGYTRIHLVNYLQKFSINMCYVPGFAIYRIEVSILVRVTEIISP